MIIEAKHSFINRIVFIGICVLLVFAPLAFGAVHVWAYGIVMVGVFGLGALLLLDRLVRKGAGEWVRSPMDWLFLLLLALIGIQMLPLPLPVLKLFSPPVVADRESLFSILASAGQTVPQSAAPAYYKHPVILEALKLSAYILMFYLVLNLADSRRRIDILVWLFVAVGLFEAFYAVYQVFSKVPMVWWWKARAGSGHYASGTYVGSNHFAGYMEIAVPLTLGFLLAQKKRTRRMLSGLGGKRAWVQRAVAWFAPESASPKMVFLFFSALIMTVSLMLSASRGGILSLTFGILVVSTFFLFKRRYTRYGTAAILFCLLAFACAAYVGMDSALGKFQRTETSFAKRLLTSKSMLPMVSDYPFLGVGWGNFRYLYPRYVPKEYDGVSSSGYSHNDWLEAVVEAGIPAGILILSAFILYLVRTIRIWKSRHDPHAVGIGAGALAAVLSLALHSLSDFNMHIPANPLALAAAAAIGYAAEIGRAHV